MFMLARLAGDPVGALGKNGNAVDDELEALSPLVGLAAQLDGPQTNARRSLVDGLAVELEARPHGVKGLLAETVGPPELGLADLEGDPFGVSSLFERDFDRGRRAPLDRDLDRRGPLHAGSDQELDLGLEPGPFLAELGLLDEDVDETDVVPGLEAHRLPDAARHETGTPVPTEAVGRLASVGTGFLLLVVCRRQNVPVLAHPVQVLGDGRAKQDPELVAFGLELACNGYAPPAIHVVRLEDELAVQVDPRVGVQSVEDDLEVPALEKERIYRELFAILPVGLPDPLQPLLEVGVEGVTYQPVAV
jgi:hypothetical protein